MADFSVTAAVGAGFRVIGRKPVAVLVWGVVIALGCVPAFLILAWVLPEFQAAMAQAAQGGAPPDLASVMRLQLKMVTLQPAFLLTNAVLRGVLSGAVYRAVLAPDEDRSFYLRFGAAELWLMLLMLVMGVLIGVGATIAMLVVGGFAAALVYALKDAAVWLAVLVVIVAVVGFTWASLWVILRLSMAAPMTFAERQFRLFESWALTRGHAGDLFALALVLGVLGMVFVGLLQGLVVGGVVGALTGGHYSEAAFSAFFARPVSAWLGEIAPWVALGVAILSLAGAALMTIWYGAWAHAYRQLRGEAA